MSEGGLRTLDESVSLKRESSKKGTDSNLERTWQIFIAVFILASDLRSQAWVKAF